MPFFVVGLFNLARLDSGRSYALSAEVTELGSPYKVWLDRKAVQLQKGISLKGCK